MTIEKKTSAETIPRLVVSIGDAGGIGPEVTFKALCELHHQNGSIPPTTLVGPGNWWKHHLELLNQSCPEQAEALNLIWDQVTLENIESNQHLPKLGRATVEQGRVAGRALERSVELIHQSSADALITAPLSKEGLHLAGIDYPGHTEYLRDLAGVPSTTMAFVGGGLVVALATVHVPLRQVFDLLTPALIVEKIRHLTQLLRTLDADKNRVAVCGINPHASEGGLFGSEEADIISPAIELARSQGYNVMGPLPGDTAFMESLHGKSDAVLAMYHDQGLAALKTIAFDQAVNITLGLPFFRTSPDHGTAFSLAGRGVARHHSMLAAFELAIKLGQSHSIEWT